MLEIVVTVVLEIAKCLVPSARSESSHLRKYKTNFRNLKEEVEKLEYERTSIQHQIDEAKRKGEEIEEKVQKWVEKADEMIHEEFPGKEETAATKRCFKRLCPDLKTRYLLSKESVEQLEAVVKHREDGKFDTISYCTSPKDARLSNKNYMAFESRESTLNDILSAISNPEITIIGIYGMGGVGKTTLAKEVAKKVEKKLFDRVVFAVVNQSPEIEKIQGEIADRLGLTISDKESLPGRAGKLCERLKQEKNILVILDDIWASLDLQEVGIPLGDDHKGCKVLLTARSCDVLSRKMDSLTNFQLRILNDKEAWNLFKRTVGNYVEGSEFQSIAMEVAKKCAGLPIALVTLAKALRNKRLFEWEDALARLNRSSSENIEGIRATIQLSYDYLESEELQKTLLLIGYSFIKSVDVLLMHGLGLGWFENINKMKDAQNRVRTLVQKLKDSSMLLDSSIFGEDFSIHDVIRDVAISIASRRHQVLTMRNVPTDQRKSEDGSILKSYSSVVFDNVGSNHELLKECPQNCLKSLLMRRVECQFPEDFFARMIELRVLDLSVDFCVGLTFVDPWSLPSSIRLLTNLRALRLSSSSNIDGLVVLGDLQNLEILHLHCPRIQQFPVEIGRLTLLKSLDLRSRTWVDELVIPRKIIRRLSQLEELYLGDFAGWGEESLFNEGRNATLRELNHLSYLTALQIKINDANTLPRDLSFLKRLESCEIFVGKPTNYYHLEDRYSSAEFSRIFKFENFDRTKIYSDVWRIMEFKKIEVLCLAGILDRNNFLYGLDNEGFSQLKHLEITNNPDLSCIVECSNDNNCAMIEVDQLRSLVLKRLPKLTSFYLISTTDRQLTLFKEKVSLPNLQTLELDETNVERIWQNQVALSCGIQNLTRLVISRCRNLRCLFSSSMARSFDRLKHLEISRCLLVEDIVFLDDGLREKERRNTMFSQLEVLIMEDLRSLTKFLCEDYIEFSSLKRLRITKCPKLKEFVVKNVNFLNDLAENPAPFFNEKVGFPSLEEIEILDVDNLKLIVQPQNAHQVLFRKLKSMKIKSCDNLKFLTLCGVDSQLESLDIGGCDALVEIVVVGNGAEQTNPIFVFPTVISLRLNDMPNFKSLFPIPKVFPNLEKLSLKRMSVEKMIWQCSEDFLPKLQRVHVGLDGPTMVSSLDFLRRFLNFSRLVIDGNSETLKQFKISLEEVRIRVPNGTSNAVITNLNECFDLKHILKEESNMDNLVDLYVGNSDNLINIVSSSVSFQNLTSLVVRNCKGLENIFTFSTAMSLIRLRAMRIEECNKIIEIVAEQGDVAQGGIIFKELQNLSLIKLKSLTSFCSGKYTFKFPALKGLVVEQCPEMRTFSEGELSTPKLDQVKRHSWATCGCWKGNLNTTIQHIHGKRENDEEEYYTRTDDEMSEAEEDAEGSVNEETDEEEHYTGTDDEVRDEDDDAEGDGNKEVRSRNEDFGQPSTLHPK